MDLTAFDADYLVIGAGALAMAFVDTLLDRCDARVVMVDRRDRPGGHWNDAYPFVRLHQPSAWYGVASTALPPPADAPDRFERGAPGHAVLDYFERLMRERFLPSGRVRWLPGCEALRLADGSRQVRRLCDGSVWTVPRGTRIVDATHARTEVAITHPPRYRVAQGVSLTTPHELPSAWQAHTRFTVVGAGKTGMDSCVWLLERGVAPDSIRWIVPRDPWLQNRAHLRTGPAYFAGAMHAATREFGAVASAASLPELLHGLEAEGLLLRLDPAVEPTAFRCAVVSERELALLRRVRDVVRLGRVQAIEATRIVLDRGELAAAAQTLYVDCSAAAFSRTEVRKVFDGDTINLVMVSWCRPMFSAALIAAVEAAGGSESEKNALCAPLPVPEVPADWLRLRAASMRNAHAWSRHPALKAWLRECRLDGTAVLGGGRRPEDAPSQLAMRRLAEAAAAAAQALPRLLAGAP